MNPPNPEAPLLVDPRDFPVWPGQPAADARQEPLHEPDGDREMGNSLRLIVESAACAPQRPSLSASAAAVAPSAEQRAIVERTIQQAVSLCGLTLPPLIVVRFVASDPTMHRGEAALIDGWLYRMVLQTSVPVAELPALVCHEAMHFADFHAGLRSDNYEQRELRACWFAVRAMEKIRELTKGSEKT